MKFLQQNISLVNFNTFGLSAKAAYFATISNSAELITLSQSEYWSLPKFILGGGSNILLLNDYDGLVIHMANKGIETIKENKEEIVLRVQAGEVWHDFVLFCVKKNYGGIENLSLIPGSVGASPMQNIGAYGVEIESVFEQLIAYSIEDKKFICFNKKDCDFGYRSSVFKTTLKDQYIITSVDFRLQKQPHLNLGYGAIKSTLEQMNIDQPSIQDVSNAVIKIRQSKLPDPKELGNSGSFFKNPIVTKQKYETLVGEYPNIPHYPIDEKQEKIPAGWLIEQCGFKGKMIGNAGTYKNQALIIVNHGNATGKEIWALAKTIQQAVKKRFDIELMPEVNLVGQLDF